MYFYIDLKSLTNQQNTYTLFLQVIASNNVMVYPETGQRNKPFLSVFLSVLASCWPYWPVAQLSASDFPWF